MSSATYSPELAPFHLGLFCKVKRATGVSNLNQSGTLRPLWQWALKTLMKQNLQTASETGKRDRSTVFKQRESSLRSWWLCVSHGHNTSIEIYNIFITSHVKFLVFSVTLKCVSTFKSTYCKTNCSSPHIYLFAGRFYCKLEQDWIFLKFWYQFWYFAYQKSKKY